MSPRAPTRPSDPRPALARQLRRWARWVPRRTRRDWIREWEAEVDAFLEAADPADPRALPDLRRRVAGARRDALALATGELRSVLGRGLALLVRSPGRTGPAVRSWMRRPGLFAVSVATLALGIAATTVLAAVAYHLLLAPLGFPGEDRLVALEGRRLDRPTGIGTVSYPDVRDVDGASPSLDGTAAQRAWMPGIEPPDGPPVVAPGAMVSWDWFRVLGVRPALGRDFLPEDEGTGRSPVAILSHGLWLRAFGGDPAVVGQGVRMNGTMFEVVGILPERYRDPGLLSYDGAVPEVWVTPGQEAGDWPRSGRSWRGIGRLAHGAELEAARTEVRSAMQRLAEQHPGENRGVTIDVVALRTPVVGPYRSTVIALLAAVALLLVVSVLNVAHLVVNRTLDRMADWRVRRALGAGDGRILADLALEGAVLAVAGGVAGVALAVVGLEGVKALAAAVLPGIGGVTLDPRVLAAVVVLLSGVTVVLSMLPFARVVRGAGTGSSGSRVVGSAAGAAMRRVLLAGQVAAAVVVLAGAGLVVRTVERLNAVDLGLDPEGALVAELHGLGMFERTPAEAEAVYRDLLERVRGIPGVAAVGAADIVALASNRSCDGFIPLDRAPPAPGEGLCGEVRSATPGYLEALGAPIERGRGLSWEDGAGEPGAMVLSRAASERFWPGLDAVGRSALVHGDTFTVVGVVADVRGRGGAVAPEPYVYLPAAQEPWNGLARGLSVLVRGEGGSIPPADAVRSAIRMADPREPVRSIRSLESLRSEREVAYRLRGAVMQLFGILSLVMAAVGLAAAVGFSVRGREREFGVRLAVGARSGDLVRTSLREAVLGVGVGTVAGLALALPAALALRPFLFGVDPWDPVALFAGPALLWAAGLAAAWVPARAAARTDPVEALRPG